jgi:hypothetical protein
MTKTTTMRLRVERAGPNERSVRFVADRHRRARPAFEEQEPQRLLVAEEEDQKACVVVAIRDRAPPPD